jgi:hypothetical protein
VADDDVSSTPAHLTDNTTTVDATDRRTSKSTGRSGTCCAHGMVETLPLQEIRVAGGLVMRPCSNKRIMSAWSTADSDHVATIRIADRERE